MSGALKEREAALLTVQCIEDDQAKKSRVISTLEEEGSQVLGGDRSKSRKVNFNNFGGCSKFGSVPRPHGSVPDGIAHAPVFSI